MQFLTAKNRAHEESSITLTFRLQEECSLPLPDTPWNFLRLSHHMPPRFWVTLLKACLNDLWGQAGSRVTKPHFEKERYMEEELPCWEQNTRASSHSRSLLPTHTSILIHTHTHTTLLIQMWSWFWLSGAPDCIMCSVINLVLLIRTLGTKQQEPHQGTAGQHHFYAVLHSLQMHFTLLPVCRSICNLDDYEVH